MTTVADSQKQIKLREVRTYHEPGCSVELHIAPNGRCVVRTNGGRLRAYGDVVTARAYIDMVLEMQRGYNAFFNGCGFDPAQSLDWQDGWEEAQRVGYDIIRNEWHAEEEAEYSNAGYSR